MVRNLSLQDELWCFEIWFGTTQANATCTLQWEATDGEVDHPRPLTIRKRGGGKRHLVAPSNPLKTLQRRLLHRYLDQQPIHDAATAFRPGSSIATHARRHLGQAIVLTVALTDFFPSTAAHRVRRLFSHLGWQGQSLQLLMRLCVYRGGLPQGAPTSPALSNLVNRPLDEQLSERAAMCGARYSRYCDDLAFSWGTESEPLVFRRQLEDTLGRFGYAWTGLPLPERNPPSYGLRGRE